MTELSRVGAGSVTVTPAALSQLVVRAAERVDAVCVPLPLPRRRVDVAFEEGRARVAREVAVRYGDNVADAAREVQHEVAGALERMCVYTAAAVDVAVEELER